MDILRYIDCPGNIPRIGAQWHTMSWHTIYIGENVKPSVRGIRRQKGPQIVKAALSILLQAPALLRRGKVR